MTRITLAALTAAALIAISPAAFAQMSSPMAASPNSAGKSDAMNTTGSMSMTCQGMMDKAHPMMSDMSDGSKKTMAMKEMDMANTAMSAGNEKTCMSHMNQAMNDMK